MVVEHAYITVSEEQSAEFEAAFLAAEPIWRAPRGVGHGTVRDVEHPGAYLLRVGWDRLEDHRDVFPGSAAGQEFAAHVAHFFTSAPEVAISAGPVPTPAEPTDGGISRGGPASAASATASPRSAGGRRRRNGRGG